MDATCGHSDMARSSGRMPIARSSGETPETATVVRYFLEGERMLAINDHL